MDSDVVKEIRERHTEDEDRVPEYCDRWRDVDQVNVSFRAAHQDRATLLAEVDRLTKEVEGLRANQRTPGSDQYCPRCGDRWDLDSDFSKCHLNDPYCPVRPLHSGDNV